MSKQIARLLVLVIFCMSLSQVISVEAQAPTPTLTTPTPTVGLTPTPLPPTPIVVVTKQPVPNLDPNMVTLEMMGRQEFQLTGPYDSYYFSFAVPAHWKLTAGASVNLRKLVAISTGIGTGGTQDKRYGSFGGTLTVQFNNKTLAILSINNVGEIPETVPIPTEALVSTRPDGRMNVGFILNSGETCDFFDKLNVIVHNDSYFYLPHDIVAPTTSLVDFPRPIYQDTFVKDSAVLVIPDKPTAGELQAALTVSSGLGNLTVGRLAVDLTTAGKLTPAQKSANHIIFIGNAGSLPKLDELKLPIPVESGSFKLKESKPDEAGVVQMVVSPWEKSRGVMVVSGNTDLATIKAARAVSSGTFRTYAQPNVALVEEVMTEPKVVESEVDKTLKDLGYEGTLFENRGIESAVYNFSIKPGWTLGPDASFQIVYGHSALLNYNRSGITILLNNTPIGSIRLSDTTAGNAVNKTTILLPATAALSGKNSLEVQVNLVPNDDCLPPEMRSLWVNIWPQSMLHLPTVRAAKNAMVDVNLSLYPSPYTYDPEMEDLAFVMQHDDAESWRSAALITNEFGRQANGSLTGLSVYYGDNFPAADRAKYNIVLMGQPDKMPIVNEMNTLMPVPFSDGNNVQKSRTFQVIYIIPTTSPMGYLETFISPWNPEKAVLAVMGNTPQGLKWASDALIDTTQRTSLTGNFAVVKEKQIITTDTRQVSTDNTDITQSEGVTVVVPQEDTTTPIVDRPSWILPTIIVLVALIIILVVSGLVSKLSQIRRK